MKKNLLLLLLSFISSILFAESSLFFYLSVRDNCKNLKDSSFGAIDANGNYTVDSNQGLNCSGFVKWVADGFYMPLRRKKNKTPMYLSLQKLRIKHPKHRGDRYTNLYEDSRDPYFGLDWTRNIAVLLAEERNNQKYDIEDFDVNDSKILNYVEDRGYPMSRIEEVLFEQAKIYPERWYLCSISGPYGENPRLYQYYHVCAFIPYTDEDGNLKIAVFERNKETSFDYLEKRYSKTFCHLVWLSMDGEFDLKIS
jgi:hypothetical protein